MASGTPGSSSDGHGRKGAKGGAPGADSDGHLAMASDTHSAEEALSKLCSKIKTILLEKLQDKFEAGDKDSIEKAVHQTQEWLDKNQLAEKGEFESKRKELLGVVSPIMAKVCCQGRRS